MLNAQEAGSSRRDDAPLLSREGTITRLAYSCLLMVGINSGWIGPFLPQISHSAHIPIERAGLIVSASAAGYFISVLIAGEIHQQLSAQKILVGAMALFTAGLVWLAIAPGLAGLLCAGILIGVANGGIDIGANALIVELNRERLASALNYLHVLFGVGALLGPLIVSAAFASRVPYWWIFGGGGLACAAIAFRLGVTPAHEVRTQPEPADGGGFIAMLSRPLIWAISAVMFLYVGAELGIGAWLFLYLRTAGALSPMLASSGVSLYWLGLVCGRAFGGRIGHRMAIPQFTMLAASLSAVALMTLIAAPAAGGPAASAMFLIGVGFGPVFPNMIAAGAARFPAEIGRMTSIVVAAGALGGIVGPWLMGHAIASISPRASMEVALAFTIAMVALALSLRRSVGGKQELSSM
jgi:fucose permease